VLGVLVVVIAVLTLLWILLRRRHRRHLLNASNNETKNELDGMTTSAPRAELSDQKMQPCAELHTEKKDFLHFELPSTPPRTPTEMPVLEIPAAEMPASRPASRYLATRNPNSNPKASLSETSETTDETLVSEQVNQQHAIARKPVPMPASQSIAKEGKPSVLGPLQEALLAKPLPKRSESARADAASLSGSMSMPRAQHTPFQAALHELFSRELRRPEE
jgi:hypothetical protein